MNRIRRFGEHGFAHYVQERSAIPIAQLIHGETSGGLPSHEAKVSSKIEEQPGEVISIGWDQIQRVMILFFIGLIIGTMVLIGEKLIQKWTEAKQNRVRETMIRKRRQLVRSTRAETVQTVRS